MITHTHTHTPLFSRQLFSEENNTHFRFTVIWPDHQILTPYCTVRYRVTHTHTHNVSIQTQTHHIHAHTHTNGTNSGIINPNPGCAHVQPGNSGKTVTSRCSCLFGTYWWCHQYPQDCAAVQTWALGKGGVWVGHMTSRERGWRKWSRRRLLDIYLHFHFFFLLIILCFMKTGTMARVPEGVPPVNRNRISVPLLPIN